MAVRAPEWLSPYDSNRHHHRRPSYGSHHHHDHQPSRRRPQPNQDFDWDINGGYMAASAETVTNANNPTALNSQPDQNILNNVAGKPVTPKKAAGATVDPGNLVPSCVAVVAEGAARGSKLIEKGKNIQALTLYRATVAKLLEALDGLGDEEATAISARFTQVLADSAGKSLSDGAAFLKESFDSFVTEHAVDA